MNEDWDDLEFSEQKYREPRIEETQGMVQVDGNWYALGSNDPVKFKNQFYNSQPQLGDM